MKNINRLLGPWEGFQIIDAKRVEDRILGGASKIVIDLVPHPHHSPRCSCCLEIVTAVHEHNLRWIRDLPILDATTFLRLRCRRVLCPRCGPKVERITWLHKHSRVTLRLAQSVARMCHVLPIKHVARFYELSWSAVKRIDKAHLTRTLGEVDLTGLEVIGIDEFAIQKGHRYASMVVEPYQKRVLWIGRGRAKADIRPFFQLLGAEGCSRLKAVVMDMSNAYRMEVRDRCPNAEVVFDLFHVIAKYGREVIDRVRVDEANRLRDDKKARKVVKGSRWLLLRNPENIKRESDRVRLKELLEANERLLTVYVLKGDLKHLWSFRKKDSAKRFWRGWLQRAVESGIKPLMTFATNLLDYLHGIFAHCDWPLHTGIIEGMNNRIKVIKRMAYGFRDDEYFFLKIRAAFPGIRP